MAARAFARIAPARAKVLFYLLAAVAAYLMWRLYDVQIRQGPSLARTAQAQRSETIQVYARRGTIYDRERNILVKSLPSESIYATPSQVTDKKRAAALLAPIVHQPLAKVAHELDDGSQYSLVARKVTHQAAERIRKLGLDGLSIVQEDTGLRYYPAGRLASTVIGFVGLDENGLDGAEYAFDSVLKGTPGRVRIEADEFGRPLPFGAPTVVEQARPGKSLELTLDSYLQFATERALRDQVKQFHAQSGTAIVMDPWTGEILALANVPDFEPAHFEKFGAAARRDGAVMDAYEPGSTFKLITAAAALESGKVKADSRFPALDVLDVGGHTIHNAEDGFMAGTSGSESLEDIIAYSHNVGAAEVGIRTGMMPLYRTIRKFGFGEATSVGLPGENPGIVPATADWWGSTLATISFGHGISVTPMGLVRAYAAIANGGTIVRPRILRSILDRDGLPVYQYRTEIEGQAMSAQTAATLRRYLRAVVVRGTGNPTARVPGYTTAGKTGTAQVVANGHYEAGAYIASFVGYIPAESPRYVILVKVAEPRGAIYGSVVAAPVFAKIAETAMLHAGVMPATKPAAKSGTKTAAQRLVPGAVVRNERPWPATSPGF